jgi:membrane protein
MPSEFPERWSKFLPPEDVTGRLRGQTRRGGTPEQEPDRDEQPLNGTPAPRPSAPPEPAYRPGDRSGDRDR